jgi:hypothetical protein
MASACTNLAEGDRRACCRRTPPDAMPMLLLASPGPGYEFNIDTFDFAPHISQPIVQLPGLNRSRGSNLSP